MKKISFFSIILLSLYASCAVAQTTWVPVSSPRGNFSFSFPTGVSPFDSLGLLSYNYMPTDDSTISFHVDFMDSVSITGSADVQSFLAARADSSGNWYGDSVETTLQVYAQMFQQSTNGTVEGFDSSNYQPGNIRGMELVVRHPNMLGDSTYCYAFTRYFYWNGKFLSFTVFGPEDKLTQLYAYKNQLFTSVAIY